MTAKTNTDYPVEKTLKAIDGKRISEGLWVEIKDEMNDKFQVITNGDSVSARRMYCDKTGNELRGEPTYKFHVNFIRQGENIINNKEQLVEYQNTDNSIKETKKQVGNGKTFYHSNTENINHPIHYGGEDNPYEAIKVIEAWGANFCIGNTLKYLSRSGKKNPDKEIEDCEKAKWYLERHIENLKKQKQQKTNQH